jgi:hypothetical protein
MKQEIKNLNKKISKLKNQVYELELNERIKINRKLIGKYFKYANGYNLEERWWLYKKIIDITKEGYIMSVQFENIPNGINIQENNISTWLDHLWIKITEEEFLEAWSKCFCAIKNLNDKL